ncbi:MAG: hypothetical protein JWO28_2429 [Hyphomicrobiales bacterium]|nr:hypothetical protein [Hyphomicrobiales bacterium]
MNFMQATYRAAVFAAALAASGPAAYAQQQPSPAALASAKEFVALTGAAQIFSPLVAGVVEQSKMLYLQQNPGLSNDLNEISAKLKAELNPRLEEVNVEMARIYATRFTETELKEIMAFYGSPTGKKMLIEQPQAAELSLKFAQDWSIKLSDEVVGKMRDELKKRGHNP